LDVPSRMDGQERTGTQKKKQTHGAGALDAVATIATSRERRSARPTADGLGARRSKQRGERGDSHLLVHRALDGVQIGLR
jgi:hypothetical protein